MEKLKPYLLWFIKIVISILFLLASIGKLTSNESVIDMFREWGYFDGFHIAIGMLELILALLILIPRTSLYAAISLFIIMIGAFFTHLLNDSLIELSRPIVFMLLLSIVIKLQWNWKLFNFKTK